MIIIIKNIFIIMMLLISGISLARASDYYVSNSTGLDSNLGTLTSPWKYCPGMTDWKGTKTLSPGDTVYFKNTDTWAKYDVSQWNTFLELTGGVTYDGMSWGTSGSRATITGSSSKEATLIEFTRDHATYPTVFNGFTVLPTAAINGICIDYPAKFNVQTGATKRISNCIVDGIGQTTVVDNYLVIAAPYGGRTVQNVEIINNIVRDGQRDGIYIYPGNELLPNLVADIVIRDNECYGNGRSSTASGCGIKLKNHVLRATIEHNYVHNNIGGGIAFDSCSEVTNGPEAIIIRYNLIMDDAQGSTKWNAAIPIASLSSTGMSTSADIYDNIMWNPNDEHGIYVSSNLSSRPVNLKIYNNIVYSGADAIKVNANNNVDIRNNILMVKSGL